MEKFKLLNLKPLPLLNFVLKPPDVIHGWGKPLTQEDMDEWFELAFGPNNKKIYTTEELTRAWKKDN